MTLPLHVEAPAPHRHPSACDHTHDVPPSSAEAAIEISHVSFSYQPGGATRSGRPPEQVLRDVSLRVESGMNLGIIGPNGAGKTTLLRLMLGLLDGYTGSISIMDSLPRKPRFAGIFSATSPSDPPPNFASPLQPARWFGLAWWGRPGCFAAIQKRIWPTPRK